MMRLNISLPTHGNVWCTIPRAGYSAPVTHGVCWNAFRRSLRHRDNRLENSERWGDPRKKLSQGEEGQAQRSTVWRALGHRYRVGNVMI